MAEKVAGPGEGPTSEADERRALEELAKLTAEPVTLRLEDGRRVKVEAVRGRVFAAFCRAMQPIRADARALEQGQVEQRDFLDVCAAHADEVLEVVQLCTGLDAQALDTIGSGDLFMLYSSALKVNADFFARGAVAAAARARLDGVELMAPEPADGSLPSSS